MQATYVAAYAVDNCNCSDRHLRKRGKRIKICITIGYYLNCTINSSKLSLNSLPISPSSSSSSSVWSVLKTSQTDLYQRQYIYMLSLLQFVWKEFNNNNNIEYYCLILKNKSLSSAFCLHRPVSNCHRLSLPLNLGLPSSLQPGLATLLISCILHSALLTLCIRLRW